jgi:hypothetical protein
VRVWLSNRRLRRHDRDFSCDPAHAARAEEFREGNEQMDRQEEQIAHELKIITPANLHKTAPYRRFTPKFANSPPTGCTIGLPTARVVDPLRTQSRRSIVSPPWQAALRHPARRLPL